LTLQGRLSAARRIKDCEESEMAWLKGKARSSGAGHRKSKRLPGSTARIAPEQRHRLSLPHEMHERRPFLADIAGRTLVAPWPRGRELPGDAERLVAVLHCLANMTSPSKVCWCWPDADRAPELIKDPDPMGRSVVERPRLLSRRIIVLLLSSRIAGHADTTERGPQCLQSQDRMSSFSGAPQASVSPPLRR
jgi:hypothetical protein